MQGCGMGNQRWTVERANAWYDAQPWLVGCNFTPSTAVNQLEMWQAETFDPDTIDRELGWAADLGFNLVRVFLHDLVWKDDAAGFRDRIDQFLGIADRHGIRAMPVLFDDCWFPDPKSGPQPAPVPGVHNSRWAQSPGTRIVRDPTRWAPLEHYVKGVVGHFTDDSRVVIWDLYNEPGNYFLPVMSRSWTHKLLRLPPLFLQHVLLPSPTLPLLRETFRWAREADPAQPLTAGVWFLNRGLNRFQLANSDVLSFHHYGPVGGLEKQIRKLAHHGRPLLCTEFMARTLDSRFETHLPVFRRQRVGCTCWGLVRGRTQTAFSWQDPPGTGEREVWFHDILWPDGTPFDAAEADAIRRETGFGAA
jgi:hypothetical protein